MKTPAAEEQKKTKLRKKKTPAAEEQKKTKLRKTFKRRRLLFVLSILFLLLSVFSPKRKKNVLLQKY